MDTFGSFLSEKKIKLSILAVLVLLAASLLMSALNGFKQFYNDTTYGNTISVRGTGEAVVIPDIANISFSVTEKGTSVSEAQDLATKKVDAALAAVKTLGVDDKDVKTTYYNVYPQYENMPVCYTYPCETSPNPKIIGYEVSQGIEVKVRKTEKAGEVLASLGSANVQNISGPNFTVDDEDKANLEARKEAIKEARAKAIELANALGVRLGKVVSFYDEDYGYPSPMYDSMSVSAEGLGMGGDMMKAPSLPVGERETSVTVNVTFEIH
jgi:uncharacterized protein YggE